MEPSSPGRPSHARRRELVRSAPLRRGLRIQAGPGLLADSRRRIDVRLVRVLAPLPTAVCGILLGLATCLVMGRLSSPRCGLVAGLATVTSCLFAEQARMIGFDMPMTLGVGVATLAAIRNLARAESNADWWVFGHIGLLFGFLAKGLPAVAMYGSACWRGTRAQATSPAPAMAAPDRGRSLRLRCDAVLSLGHPRRWPPRGNATAHGDSASRHAVGLGAVLNTLLKPLVSLAAFLPASTHSRWCSSGGQPKARAVARQSPTGGLGLSPERNGPAHDVTGWQHAILPSLGHVAGHPGRALCESFRFRLPGHRRRAGQNGRRPQPIQPSG